MKIDVTHRAYSEYIPTMPSLVSLMAFAAAAAAATIKDCGAGKSAFTINALSISPINPVAGKDVTVNLEYTVPTGMVITGGLTTYSVTYNFIPFSPTTEPLCRNVPCPLTAGIYTNHTTTQWPSGMSGSVVSRMTWADETNNLLLCIDVSGKVR